MGFKERIESEDDKASTRNGRERDGSSPGADGNGDSDSYARDVNGLLSGAGVGVGATSAGPPGRPGCGRGVLFFQTGDFAGYGLHGAVSPGA